MEITSNVDLTPLTNNRIGFEKIAAGLYRVTTRLKFYSSEQHNFIYRFLKRKLIITHVVGCCSSPSGYIFGKRLHG
jgi:hypothetical protein